MNRFRITWNHGYGAADGTSEEHDITWFGDHNGIPTTLRDTMFLLDVGDSIDSNGPLSLDSITIQRVEDGPSDLALIRHELDIVLHHVEIGGLQSFDATCKQALQRVSRMLKGLEP